MREIRTVEIDSKDIKKMLKGRPLSLPPQTTAITWAGTSGPIAGLKYRRKSLSQKGKKFPCGYGTCTEAFDSNSKRGSHRFKAHGIRTSSKHK